MKQEIREFIGLKIKKVRQSVLKSMDEFKLTKILVNPYIPSAFFSDPDDFIRCAFQASMFKSMQTKFGKLLESVSIKVRGRNSAKTGMPGVDLDFIMGQKFRLLMSVKSGPTWGNTQSTKKQGDQFRNAKRTINENDVEHEIVLVMGICCSNLRTSDHLDYADIQICGQSYWYLISGESDFYQEIIKEINAGVDEFNKIFKEKFEKTCVRLVEELKCEYYKKSESNLPLQIWESVAAKNCGNLSKTDAWLNKIMLSEQEGK